MGNEHSEPGRPNWKTGLLGPIATGAGYFLTAYVALLLTQRASGIATLWAPSGILFAALVLSGRRALPGYLLAGGCASLAANLLGGNTWPVAIGFTVANLVESALAARLVRGAEWRLPSFVEPREVVHFCGIGIAATALSASLATLVCGAPSLDFWASWFSTDLLGLFIVGPIILTTHQAWPRGKSDPGRFVLPAMLDMAGVALVTVLAFTCTGYSLLFLPLAASFFATLRRGPLGASASVTIIATVGCLLTALGYGPLAMPYESDEAVTLYFQFYLLVVVASGLPIASLVTAKNRLFDRLADTNRLLMIAEASSGVGHWRLDIGSGMVFASPVTLRIHGIGDRISFPVQEALGAYHPEDRALVDAAITAAIAGETDGFEYEARIVGPGGECYVRSRGTVDRAPDGMLIGVVGTLQDISEQRATELVLLMARAAAEEAAKQAITAAETDPLTGIANRRKLLATIDGQIEIARSGTATLSCAMIDIDHFKSINDRFGHAVGDRVLQTLAATAKGALRAGDLIGRLGGEEFVVVLPDTAEDQAVLIGERIRAAIAATRIDDLPAVTVTVSIGVATYAADISVADLLARADRALYAAKGAGRNAIRLAA
jgi:diguanylate cyclase (GGDEF)-like protein